MSFARGGTPSRRCRDHEYQNEPPPPPPTTTTTAKKAQQQPQQQLGQQQHQQVTVEFEIALRLRPLGKKERDDHIVLEVVPPDCSTNQQESSSLLPNEASGTPLSTQQQQLLPTSVALHPIPRPDLTPSSALILQTLSPETIQTCHDVEFRFDYVFDAHASQDAHVYPTLGRPMAHSVMEPIMNMHSNIMHMNTPEHQQAGHKKTTHLVIAMGGQGSGKTYTCWGGGSQISKRKTSLDGLVPRMVDSLFGQFLRISSQQQQQQQKMHPQQRNGRSTSARQSPSCSFAVNLSILQVNQSKNPKHASSSDGCKVYDLFQPVIVGNPIITSAMTLSPKVKSLVASFERSHRSSPSPHPTNAISSSYGNSHHNLDATVVHVHQDPITHEFHIMNGQVRTCKSAERARDALQEAFQNSRKRTSKRHQSHVLIQIQPVLLDNKTGHVVCEGGSIVVLDMAGNDDNVGFGTNNNKTRLRAGSKRNKDSLPNRNDAHSAVLHCLRSIQFNEQVRRGGSSPMSNNNNDDTSMSDLSGPSQHQQHEKSASLSRRASFKQVPYRQHVLTMLLQPCFSSCRTDQTQVSILLAASPGHRDYHEKKAIMTEIESFWTPKTLPAKQVMTGCLPAVATTTTTSKSKPQPNLPTKPSPSRSKKQPRALRGDSHHHYHCSASDADDEFESGTTESKSSSMTSTTTDRPPKYDSSFKKGGGAAHLATTNTSLPVKLPLSSRKKASRSNRPLLYPSSDADDEFESSTTTELQSSSTSSSNARPLPTNHNDIFKTKGQHALVPGGGGGVEHTLSMAYSDSSMEDDYYTLPPPIAPPPMMTTTSFGRSNSRPPQRVMSPDASAPPEEHVVVVNKPLTMLPAKPLPVDISSSCNSGTSRGFQVPFLSDFPGVPLPFGRTFAEYTSSTATPHGGIEVPPTCNHVQQQQNITTASLPTASGSNHHHSHSIESPPEVACVKPTMAADNSNSSMNSVNISTGVHFADESGSSSSLSATKFNAMKNINKLVHASKKKCERVFEKMATPAKDQYYEPSHANSINDGNETNVLKQRVKELEVQNANLLRENESLRKENEQLRASSALSISPNSLENRGFREQSNNSTKIVLPSNHGQPSPEKQQQQHSTFLDQESLTSPRDHRLHDNSPDRLIAYSPGEPLVASPGHGRCSPHTENRFLPLSPGKPTSSSESQTSLKENALSSYSPVNQPLDGPLALMPGQSLSGSQDQRSLKQSDRSHVMSARKPLYSSDKEGERKFQSSSFLQSPSSPFSCSRAYPSDDENVTPPPRRAGISIPMPGEANYVVPEDKLRHHSAPTSPIGFGRRDDDCATATTSSLWQREGRMGAAVSYTTAATNDSSNKDSTTLGSFPSNYKSTLYRWQA